VIETAIFGLILFGLPAVIARLFVKRGIY